MLAESDGRSPDIGRYNQAAEVCLESRQVDGMRRFLILGAGFGGLAAAQELRSRLPEGDEIVLVDRKPSYIMGLRKWWAVIGRSSLEEGRRDLRSLETKGLSFVQGVVEAIDPARRAATVGGRVLEADAVLLALGAEHAVELVPGYREHALNPYDPNSIPAIRERLESFTGGRVGVGIFGIPYTCPPAPYELALLLRDDFERRSVRAEVEVFTPTPLSLPVIGQENCSTLESLLEERGVRFLPEHRALKVLAGEVVFATGSRPYDLLLGIPPHRCPAAVVAAGLAQEGGWVRVDLATMATSFAGVYAIGDLVEIPLANGMALPKAGVFAEEGAAVAVESILASFSAKGSPRRFDGHGFCFLESGRGEALEVRGDFLAEPKPKVEVAPPTRERLSAKEAFERERLTRWFG
jgi:sulfide:quinone oxidoreductase